MALGRTLAVFALVPLILGTGQARAQDEDEELNERYILSAIYLQLQGRNGIPLGDGSSALGLSASAGLRPNQYFALEIAYEWLPGFSASEFLPGAGLFSGDIDSQVASINLKGYYPFGRIQPFVLVGPSMMFLDSDVRWNGIHLPGFGGSDFALRVGGGLDFFILDRLVLALAVDYVRGFGSRVDDFDYVSIGWGLKYRFLGE
jgi:opacity protein-like surface antigen